MASIDLARAYTEGPGPRRLPSARRETCGELREYIARRTGFIPLTYEYFPALDPCRLTVCTAGTDATGHQLANMLWSEAGVACEMADDRNAVFILTGADTAGAVHRLRRGLRHISRRRREALMPAPAAPFRLRARHARARCVVLADRPGGAAAAENLVCARPVTPYPPGVPLLWPGEKITRAHIELIRERWYNDISEITVVIS